MSFNKKNPHIQLTASYDVHAAHKLYRPEWDEQKNASIYGHCASLHGHQYKLEVTVEGVIPKDTGMLINGYELDRIVKESVLNQIDHKCLNEDVAFFKEYPSTAEWIAVWVFNQLKEKFPPGCCLKSIRLFETPSLYAEYSEN